MDRPLLKAAALFSSILFCLPATAQSKQQHDQCVNKNDGLPFDTQIVACTAVIRSGGQAWAMHNRGRAYVMKGRVDEGIADYNDAIRMKPSCAAYYLARGFAYAKKQDNDRAIADYSRVLQLPPNDCDGIPYLTTKNMAAGNLRSVYRRKGDFDHLIADAAQQLSRNPGDASARNELVLDYQSRGASYLANGNPTSALQDLRSALSLDPNNLRTRLLMAQGAPEVAETNGLPVEIVPSVGHASATTSVTASSDGKWLASSGVDGIKIWERSNYRLLRTFSDNQQIVHSAAFLPDSRTIVAGGEDKMIRLWNIETGKVIRTFSGHTDTVTAILTNGQQIVSASQDKTVKVWDVRSGTLLRTFSAHENRLGINSIALLGSTVLSGDSKGQVKIWNLDTGQIERSLSNDTNSPAVVAISADGRRVLVGGDKKAIVFDRATGSAQAALEAAGQVSWAGFTPDGQTAIVGTRDYSISLWDATTGKKTLEFSGIENRGLLDSGMGIAKLMVSLNGLESATLLDGDKQLVSVVRDIGGGSMFGGNKLKFWNLANGELVREIGPSAGGNLGIHSLARDASKDIFFFPVGGAVRKFDLAGGKITDVLTNGESRSFAFNAASNEIYAGDYNTTIRSVSAATGVVGAGFTNKRDGEYDSDFSLEHLTVIPNTNLVVTTKFHDKTSDDIQIRDAKTWKVERNISDVGGNVTTLAATSDGRLLLAGLKNGTVVGWNVQDGAKATNIKAHNSQVTAITFSKDDQRFATTEAFKTKVWDRASGALLREITGHSRAITDLLFSENGQQILLGSADRFVSTINISTGTIDGVLAAQTGVTAMRFSADGRRLVTAGDDSTIRVWDRQSGRGMTTTILFPSGDWVTITPEGFFDASDQGAQLLTVVHGLEVYAINQFYQLLYRPDLVREKLAGDPNGKVKAAAAQLDLDKVMASGAAPRVTVTSPASASSATDEVAVEATIADQGGGIGKVEWRVNGVTVGLESRGLDRIETSAVGSGGSGRPQSVKRTLSLELGDNRIEIVAYNAKGLIASEPALVTVKWDGAKTASPPKLYVLAVGVNDYYDGRLHLAYAVPDATALAEGFKKAGNGLYASVEVKTVLDSDVTLANLDNVFAELSHKVQPRDVFVFFLAGHGKTKNGRYYFLPRDFRYEDDSSIEKAGMGQDKFQAWLATIPARKSLLLYDTCESGSLTGATRGSDVDERLGALNRMARATGRTFLTATTDDAPALEGYRGHGVFTYALLGALAHADVNRNGLIEVSELADYIDQKVPEYSFEAFKLRQIPQRSIVGNNFALTNKAEVLAATQAGDVGDTSVPKTPTHVVAAPTYVKVSASDASPTVAHFSPGTQVRLIEAANGWALIARDGKKLGYLPSNALLGLQ